MIRLLIIGLFALLAAPVMAQDSLFPDIPKATGEAHPEGNEYWRINHPDMLRHDRNLTVHEGDRQIQASISECVTCHAVKGPDAAPVTIESDQHFCRACHDYAAVKIDCFQCHSSVSEDTDQALLLPGQMLGRETELDALRAYLEGASQ